MTGTDVVNGRTQAERKRCVLQSRDGTGCYLCECTPRRGLTLHHRTMRYFGGGNHIRNLVALCRKCHHHIHDPDSVRLSNMRIDRWEDVKMDASQYWKCLYLEEIGKRHRAIGHMQEEIERLQQVIALSDESRANREGKG